MHVALKLGLTRLLCVYNVPVVKKYEEILQWMEPPKKQIWINWIEN